MIRVKGHWLLDKACVPATGTQCQEEEEAWRHVPWPRRRRASTPQPPNLRGPSLHAGKKKTGFDGAPGHLLDLEERCPPTPASCADASRGLPGSKHHCATTAPDTQGTLQPASRM